MPALEEIFASCTHLVRNDGTQVAVADLAKTSVVGLYFSAHWCGPCRGFTPELVNVHKELAAAGKSFEVVFVSSDEDQDAFDGYFGEMPWLALPYSERALKESLSEAFEVQGIPTLVLLSGSGEEITRDGREAVGYGAAFFPFGPEERAKGEEAAREAEEARMAAAKAQEAAVAAEQAKDGRVVFRRVRGDVGDCIAGADYTVKFDQFSTAAAPDAKATGGKVFYEIKVVKFGGVQQAGWADDGFDLTIDRFSGDGVGDDATSWGIDGGRKCKWFEGESEWGEGWATGDVIGFAADLDAGELSFGRNGQWGAPMGCAFQEVRPNGGLFPAITADGTTIQANFGGEPWLCGPPSEGFVGIGVVGSADGDGASEGGAAAPPQPPPSSSGS